MCVRVCGCVGGRGGGETIVFLQYVTHKCVAETNIFKAGQTRSLWFVFSSLDTININIVQI